MIGLAGWNGAISMMEERGRMGEKGRMERMVFN
jgi:hypothetical protein